MRTSEANTKTAAVSFPFQHFIKGYQQAFF